MAAHLEVLLAGIASNRRGGSPTLPLLTGRRTRNSLLLDWNDTDQHVPPSVLPALFEAQAARTPTATAVYDAAGNPLSYAALNELANRLARLLVARGARPETFVATGAAELAAVDRRAARGAEGGCGVPADRPGISAGADRVHAVRHRARAHSHRRGVRRAVARRPCRRCCWTTDDAHRARRAPAAPT